MPQGLLTPWQAIRLALARFNRARWSPRGPTPAPFPATRIGPAAGCSWIGDTPVNAPADAVFRAACRVGGRHGYYGAHGCAGSGLARQPRRTGGRPRAAAGAPRPGCPALRRRRGFLAGHGRRAWPAPAPACGDESARPRSARILNRPDWRFRGTRFERRACLVPAHADGHVPSPRPHGLPVLVLDAAVPPLDLTACCRASGLPPNWTPPGTRRGSPTTAGDGP